MSLNKSSPVDTKENASSFSDLYKNSGRTMSQTQAEKRKIFLETQKEKRNDAFDEKRDLSDLFADKETESMDCESAPNKSKRTKKIPFGFKLMQSEWLTEIPEDFELNWLIKVCPEGVRYLVVANKGVTTCYLRNGRSCFKFKSKLPGGSPQTYGHRFTVLDCIFNKNSNTFLIYDVLAWNSLSLINAEASLRFFWIKSRIDDAPELCESHDANQCKFVLVDSIPAAEIHLLQDLLSRPFVVGDVELPLEGVLFYHIEGHYVFQKSPLVGWLKSFMLPEVLHINVDPIHCLKKPENYESVDHFLKTKHKKRRKHQEMMDLELVGVEVESTDCDEMFM